uniref:uncharacterized protein LOC125908314 n=1 Tax=Anopheles coluzzii TaxID=1518534 RepID=UPI0020FFEF48|nr:uncharacterized protein LOC125908314 [Anopheles coluzzii]
MNPSKQAYVVDNPMMDVMKVVPRKSVQHELLIPANIQTPTLTSSMPPPLVWSLENTSKMQTPRPSTSSAEKIPSASNPSLALQPAILSSQAQNGLASQFPVSVPEEDAASIAFEQQIPVMNKNSLEDADTLSSQATSSIATEVIGFCRSMFDQVMQRLDQLDSKVNKLDKRTALLQVTVDHIKDCVKMPHKVAEVDKEMESLLKPISTPEELTIMEEKLADVMFFNTVKQWIESTISSGDTDNRLHEAIDVMFTREFMPSCSWKGRSPTAKIALANYKAIIKIFKEIGSTPLNTISEGYVAKFFKTKLPHAKERLNLAGNRKVMCIKRKAEPRH